MSIPIIFMILTALLALYTTSLTVKSFTVTIAVDLAHGESDKYLKYIMGNITFVKWKVIEKGSTITSDLLADVDILLIGQPTVAFTPDELEAIASWLNTGRKVLYIAGDSDYGTGPTTIDNVNKVLEYIGAKLRLDQAAAYAPDNPTPTYTYKGKDWPVNAKAYYRMLAFVEPDNIPELNTQVIDEGITKPILMHGPGVVIWVDEKGVYHDPVKETFPGLIRIAWFHKAYIGDNKPPAPYLYNPLTYGSGSFDFIGYAAEYWSDKNVIITVAAESLYGDYEPAWASAYYGVELDGPKFVTNLIKWWISVITTKFVTVTQTQTATKTVTSTATLTVKETITQTATTTQRVTSTLTQTLTSISTTTVTQEVGTYTLALAGVSVVLLIALIAVLLMKRK